MLGRLVGRGQRRNSHREDGYRADTSAEMEPRGNRRRSSRLLLKIGSTVVFLLLWQSAVSLHVIDAVIVASPWQTLLALKSGFVSGQLLTDVYWTMRRLVVGFVCAAVAAVVLGYAMATVEAVGDALDWLVQAIRSISPLALVPLTVLWFGLGETQKYVIIGITVFFPILLNVQAAVRDVPTLLLRAAQTLGCRGRLALFRRIVIPAAIPHMIEGLRVGLGIGFLVIIAAEMIGASRGLGYLVFHAGQEFDTQQMFAGITCIAVLGVLMDRFMLLAKRRLAPWFVGREPS